MDKQTDSKLQTDRQTDRRVLVHQTDRQTDRQTSISPPDRQTDRHLLSAYLSGHNVERLTRER